MDNYDNLSIRITATAIPEEEVSRFSKILDFVFDFVLVLIVGIAWAFLITGYYQNVQYNRSVSSVVKNFDDFLVLVEADTVCNKFGEPVSEMANHFIELFKSQQNKYSYLAGIAIDMIESRVATRQCDNSLKRLY